MCYQQLYFKIINLGNKMNGGIFGDKISNCLTPIFKTRHGVVALFQQFSTINRIKYLSNELNEKTCSYTYQLICYNLYCYTIVRVMYHIKYSSSIC